MTKKEKMDNTKEKKEAIDELWFEMVNE